jgi:helix-turn-helix protein
MSPTEINTNICKFLGVDPSDIQELYLRLIPNELPQIVIRKLSTNSEEVKETYFKVIPLD